MVLVGVSVVLATVDAHIAVDDEAVGDDGPLCLVYDIEQVDSALVGLGIEELVVGRAGVECHVAMRIAAVVGRKTVVERGRGVSQPPGMLPTLGLPQVGVAHSPLACVLPDASVAEHGHTGNPLRDLVGIAEGEMVVDGPREMEPSGGGNGSRRCDLPDGNEDYCSRVPPCSADATASR